MKIRPIAQADDAAIATVIRTVMPEFGASGAGFAINDPEVDFMSRAYSIPKAAYWVVVREDGTVQGGGGIAPLLGGEPSTCELRKMYLMPEARGLGLGEALIRQCLQGAKELGFHTCYLETLNTMVAAQGLYEKLGFTRTVLQGATGHSGCDRFYSLALAA